MQAFPEFKNMPFPFWAFVKYISDICGYTDRKLGVVRTYTREEIQNIVIKNKITCDCYTIEMAKMYFDRRAFFINNFIRHNLMDGDTAKKEFEKLYPLYCNNNFKCKLPMNKQKGEMKQIAYFTAIINILTENTVRKLTGCYDSLGFDDDPRGLVYMFDNDNHIIGASSRRFDGAYPSTINPRIIWEIKEYYYATTFGSRVADGVYETQLDGYEFKNMSNYLVRPVTHVFFLDGYKTWWIDGKSYLCRIIDILNCGLVDEVIIGKEVFSCWPELLESIILDKSK